MRRTTGEREPRWRQYRGIMDPLGSGEGNNERGKRRGYN